MSTELKHVPGRKHWKGRFLAVIAPVAALGWLVAGCNAQVSIGGASSVPKHTVETEVATTLAQQAHQPDPNVVCPGDLRAKIGTVMYCSLSAQASTTVYPVKVQVVSISGSHVHFHITVSQTPGHFTAPA